MDEAAYIVTWLLGQWGGFIPVAFTGKEPALRPETLSARWIKAASFPTRYFFGADKEVTFVLSWKAQQLVQSPHLWEQSIGRVLDWKLKADASKWKIRLGMFFFFFHSKLQHKLKKGGAGFLITCRVECFQDEPLYRNKKRGFWIQISRTTHRYCNKLPFGIFFRMYETIKGTIFEPVLFK